MDDIMGTPAIAFVRTEDEGMIAKAMTDPRAPILFGHDGDFLDEDDAQRSIVQWLSRPGVNLAQVLDAPLSVFRPFSAGKIGDTMIDPVLAGVLLTSGIDPRAFATAMIFHDDDIVEVDGMTISVCTIQNIKGGDVEMRLTATITLAPGISIDTEKGWIDMDRAMPNVTLEAALGRSLTRLLSHPRLDGLGLQVEEAVSRGGGVRITHEARAPIRIGDIKVTHG